jgi:hypothetical protein
MTGRVLTGLPSGSVTLMPTSGLLLMIMNPPSLMAWLVVSCWPSGSAHHEFRIVLGILEHQLHVGDESVVTVLLEFHEFVARLVDLRGGGMAAFGNLDDP